jgi:hypothetical protein
MKRVRRLLFNGMEGHQNMVERGSRVRRRN